MKSTFLVFCTLLFSLSLAAQSSNVDSLKQLLEMHPEADSVRMDLLYGIGHALLFKEPEKAKTYYEEVLELCKVVENKTMEARVYNSIGVVYCIKGNYEEGLANYFKSIEIFEAKGDKPNLGSGYGNIAGVYIFIEEHETAIEYIQKSLTIHQELGDSNSMATNYQGIAINLQYLIRNSNNLEEAEKNEMITLAEENYQKALTIYKKFNNKKDQAICLTNLGILYSSRGEIDQAIAYELSALELKSDMSLQSKSISYKILGSSYRKKKIFKKAESYLLQAYHFVKEVEDDRELEAITKELYLLYAETNKFDQFLKFQEENEQLQKGFLEKEQNKQVLELKEKYETAQKEKENLALQKEATLIRSRSNLFGLIGLLLFFGLLAGGYLYQKLRNNNKQLETINASKNQLFGILAHDLKGPAASFRNLSGKISYLLRQNDQERLLDFADHFEKAGNRINYVLNNLLDWAISQKDEFLHDPQTINVNEYLNMVTNDLDYALNEKGLLVQNNLEEDLKCFFDKNAMTIISRNLLHNAIKYSHPNSTIEIRSEDWNGGKRMLIIDHGIGMSEEQIERAISGLPSESQKGTENERGNGLGLSTCVKLITKNKSKLAIESTPGEGATMILNLPNAN